MSLFDDVCQMYRKSKIGTNKICSNCNLTHKVPISIWHIGDNFSRDKYKILFVGRTAMPELAEVVHVGSGGYADVRKKAEEFFFDTGKHKRPWPFWRYTKELVSSPELYGSPKKGWERIALTNIIKCIVEDKDNKDALKNKCICELGIIRREIEILKPKNVIFYTYDKYDVFIEQLIGALKRAGEKKVSKHSIPIKSKTKGNPLKFDTEEIIGLDGQIRMRFLITSHPRGQDKERFFGKLIAWIRDGTPGNQ